MIACLKPGIGNTVHPPGIGCIRARIAPTKYFNGGNKMQLYFIADQEGHLADNRVLQCGKIKTLVGSKQDPLAKYSGPVHTSAIVAALTHPDSIDGEHNKMFEVNRWKVSVDSSNPEAYTVVKEVAVPTVTLGQKVAFTVATIKEIYHDSDFTSWAEDWLSGKDRSAESARACREATEREIEASEQTAALAAWGASGADDQEDLKRQEDLEQRAVFAAQAAELLATDGAEARQILDAIKQSMNKVSNFGRVVDLASVAEQVLQLNPE
jgi:hypothetical protein